MLLLGKVFTDADFHSNVSRQPLVVLLFSENITLFPFLFPREKSALRPAVAFLYLACLHPQLLDEEKPKKIRGHKCTCKFLLPFIVEPSAA